METITLDQYFLAILSFLVVCCGASGIGVFYGILTSLCTKYTTSIRVIEPMAVLALAYMAYLTSELFSFSGILAIIMCGVVQAHYTFLNISRRSFICVKYFVKMASSVSDTVIFMYIGIIIMHENWIWNTGFTLWSIFFCLIYRIIGVFVLAAITNPFRDNPLQFEEQAIAGYAGLRGAIAFCLASTMNNDMHDRATYICSTLSVIIFTVFFQGISMKPFVQLLKNRKAKRIKRDQKDIVKVSLVHLVEGIKDIVGQRGDSKLKQFLTYYDEKYWKKWLLHSASDHKHSGVERISAADLTEQIVSPVKPFLGFDENKDYKIQMPLTKEEEMLLRETDNKRRVSTFFPYSKKDDSSETNEDDKKGRDILREILMAERNPEMNNNINEDDMSIRSFEAQRVVRRENVINRPKTPDADDAMPGQVQSAKK